MGLNIKMVSKKTAIVSELSNSNISLQLCGDGMIGCDGEESCGDPTIDNSGMEFYIYDNLGIMTSVENVLDYINC